MTASHVRFNQRTASLKMTIVLPVKLFNYWTPVYLFGSTRGCRKLLFFFRMSPIINVSALPTWIFFIRSLKFGGKFFIYAGKFLFPYLTTQCKNKKSESPFEEKANHDDFEILNGCCKSLMSMILNLPPPFCPSQLLPTNTTKISIPPP